MTFSVVEGAGQVVKNLHPNFYRKMKILHGLLYYSFNKGKVIGMNKLAPQFIKMEIACA